MLICISIRNSPGILKSGFPDGRHFILVQTFSIIDSDQTSIISLKRPGKPGMGKARMSPVGPTSRVACFLITNLPVKAERGHYPILRRRPLVIVERIGIRDIVLDSSPEAIGVAPGMALGEALKACGKATVVQADRNHYQDVDDRIVDALQRRFGAVLRGRNGTGVPEPRRGSSSAVWRGTTGIDTAPSCPCGIRTEGGSG